MHCILWNCIKYMHTRIVWNSTKHMHKYNAHKYVDEPMQCILWDSTKYLYEYNTHKYIHESMYYDVILQSTCNKNIHGSNPCHMQCIPWNFTNHMQQIRPSEFPTPFRCRRINEAINDGLHQRGLHQRGRQ